MKDATFANKRHFPIGDKAYQLQLYLQQLIHNFRKEYKYDLGREISQKSWEVSDLIYQANSTSVSNRPALIEAASIAFDQLKNRVSMAYDLKLISHKQLAHIVSYYEELGKMMTGWKRWSEKQSSTFN